MASNHWTKICAVTFLAPFCLWISPQARASDQRHVVVVVWDGMRPDFVTEELTPVLWKLAQEGVVFRNNHAVYLSATNVNGTAIATGDYPEHSGLIANHEFRSKIDARKPVDVELPEVVEKGDALSGGKYIAVPTIAELVRQSGGRTVVASAKTVGSLLDRKVDQAGAVHPNRPADESSSRPIANRPYPGQAASVTFAAGRAWPNESLNQLLAALGPFPKSHPAQDDWTTKAFTEMLWKNGVPTFSLLWLGEPDLTQHETAPGDPAALRAIKSSDEKLSSVLSALDKERVRDKTDIFVVSDHGFSTIEHEIDLPQILRDAGFDAVTEFKGEPQKGQIMLVGVGGSVLIYLPDHDAALARRLTEFLQQTNYAGAIFSKEKFEGTFSLDQAQINSPDAPDILMSFRWDENKNRFGVPGMIDADWQRAAGKGTHATLSRFDMHNTLIASGPDFKKGLTSDIPSGNIDLAPTILKILGISSPTMDGRVLSEAMLSAKQTSSRDTRTIDATKAFPGGTWDQSLHISQVGSTVYLDEGDGAFTPNQR